MTAPAALPFAFASSRTLCAFREINNAQQLIGREGEIVVKFFCRSKLLCAASAVVIGALGAASAVAQSQSPPAPGDAATPVSATDQLPATPVPAADQPAAPAEQGLGDIVVTARRVAERGQDIPVAVTAIGGEALQRSNILQSSDLQFKVPALTVTGDVLGGDAAPNFAIRGLAQELGTEPTVVVYFAGAAADTRGVGNTLYDLANVQVVRGPQGTLFGKNSIGGAVLIEPARPGNDFSGSLQARYGNYNAVETTGVVNVPLAEGAKLRVAGNYVRQDGLIKNLNGPDANNKNRWSARASLLLNPTDWLENSTVLQYFKLRQRGSAGIFTATAQCPDFPATCFFTPGNPFSIPGYDLPGALAEQKRLGARTIDNPGLARDRNTDRRVINTTTATAGALTLKNIFSYSNGDYAIEKDLDGSKIPLFDDTDIVNNKGWTEEFQIGGKALSDRLKFLVGFYHNDATQKETNISVIFGPINPTNPSTGISTDKFLSTALFAQGTFDLEQLLKGLSFTGGYRYTWDKRRQALLKLQGPTQTCAFISPVTGGLFSGVDPDCTRRLQSKFSSSGYTYGLDYKVVPGVLVYVSRNRAYKAGGFNPLDLDPTLTSYDPEIVVDTEAGIKADWHIAGRPIRTNVSLYRMKFSNIQLENTNIFQGIGQSFTANGSNATLKGIEFELNARPTRRLSVDASATFEDGKYTTLVAVGPNGLVAPQPPGRAFSYVPAHTYRLAASWELPLPPSVGNTVLSVDYYYQSSEPGLVTHPEGPLNTIPSYGIANARLDIRGIGGSPVDLGLYVKNLTNKAYVNNVLDDVFLAAFATRNYGEPRLYGLQLTYRFGAAAK